MLFDRVCFVFYEITFFTTSNIHICYTLLCILDLMFLLYPKSFILLFGFCLDLMLNDKYLWLSSVFYFSQSLCYCFVPICYLSLLMVSYDALSFFFVCFIYLLSDVEKTLFTPLYKQSFYMML
jgi:hypothetical protein